MAGFTLLAAMGAAEVEDLGLEDAGLYDPSPRPLAARERLFDFGRVRGQAPVSTRTVDTPAQSADAPTVEEPVDRSPIE